MSHFASAADFVIILPLLDNCASIYQHFPLPQDPPTTPLLAGKCFIAASIYARIFVCQAWRTCSGGIQHIWGRRAHVLTSISGPQSLRLATPTPSHTQCAKLKMTKQNCENCCSGYPLYEASGSCPPSPPLHNCKWSRMFNMHLTPPPSAGMSPPPSRVSVASFLPARS